MKSGMKFKRDPNAMLNQLLKLPEGVAIKQCLRRTDKKYLIGIDAGRHTGVCVISNETKQIKKIITIDFWRAFFMVVQEFKPDNCIIIVEAPKLNFGLFAKFDDDPNLTDQQKGSVNRTREKIARDIGGNGREAELFAEGVSLYGFEAISVRPKTKKLEQKEFEHLTGYKFTVSEHARDAAKLCIEV
jgi:hypothetical protein